MKHLKSILALGAFFVVGLALSACGSSVGGGDVATVAGNPISVQTFNHWMYVAAKGNASQDPTAPVIVPNDPPNFTGCLKQVRAEIPQLAKESDKTIESECKQLFTSLSTQVMDFLIRSYWYQATAYKLGIKITPAQIQQAFQTAKKQQFSTNSAYESFLTSSGQTAEDIMYRVRVNQIYSKLLAKHEKTVTPALIAAYYAAHTSQFGKPEKRNIRIVRTNSEAQAKAALKALQHGQSWNAVAKHYSVDTTTKNRGGLLTGIVKGQEEHVLDVAAFSAPQNKLEGPIHGQFGYYVFEVTNITPGSTESLAKSSALIRQILAGQEQTTAQNAVDAQAKKEWLAKTTCGSNYAMDDCSGYKAPKTTTSSGTATSTAPSTATTP